VNVPLIPGLETRGHDKISTWKFAIAVTFEFVEKRRTAGYIEMHNFSTYFLKTFI
jgi:hypothetical protein